MNTPVIFTRLRFPRIRNHLLLLLLASQFIKNLCLSLVFIKRCFLPILYHWLILLYSIVSLDDPLNLILICIHSTGKRTSSSRVRTVERFHKINYLRNFCHLLFLVVFFLHQCPSVFALFELLKFYTSGLCVGVATRINVV